MARHSPWNIDRMDRDRLGRGWTKRRLAAIAGVSEATVTRWFQGEVQTPGTAKKLADALGHPVSRYVRGAEADPADVGQKVSA